jgi:aspartate aminotransferase
MDKSACKYGCMVSQSATLAVNERLEARQTAGDPVLNLGFGEAGLPVLPAVAQALAEATACNRYGPVAGSRTARQAAAGYFTRRGLPTSPEQIVFAPGSKPLLYAIVASLPGTVILPRPSWVSYAAQAALAHKPVLWVPSPPAVGGVPDPDRLAAELARTARTPSEPRAQLMVLTVPDNPTGTLAPRRLVEEVCAIAAAHDITVVSDEIYRELAYDPGAFTSPAELLPETCVVTTGLSKSMSIGGWRVGFARFPDGPRGAALRREVVGVASEVWSSLAEPLQAAAAYVLDEPLEVQAHIVASRRLHRRVATAVHGEFLWAGAACRPPRAAFYIYPDLDPLRPGLAHRGITTGAALAEHLLEQHGIGVLAGAAFGDDPEALRFRVASSLLYGRSDEQRWAALGSDDPLALPWIDAALRQLRSALTALGDDIPRGAASSTPPPPI